VPKGNNPDKNAAIKALGLAGLFKLRQELEGKTVCVILSAVTSTPILCAG